MSTIEQQVEAFEASVSDGAALGLLSGTPDGQVSIAGGQAAWVPIDVEPARSHTNSPNSVLQTARERSPYKPGGNSEAWPSDRSAARRCTGSDTSGIASCVEGDCHPTARNTIRLPVARSAVLAAAPPREQQRRTHASSRVRAADIGPEADRIRQLQAAIAAAAGERESARELAQAELADVRVFGAPRALGVASRVAGLAEGGERGIELLHESVAGLRDSPALLELAHSLTELGAALRRAASAPPPREPLAEALELAVRCGARRLAGRAREELKATGARPRREWRTGVEALTPSELRIVRLAAEGRTNREIAQELYVTLKTVEGHLSRAYTKLGIEGRAELSGVLEGEKTRVPTL